MPEIVRTSQPSANDAETPALITYPTPEEFQRLEQARLAKESAQQAWINKWREAEKRKVWKGRMKKVMATTALLATVKSGGFIDMAADPFSEAGHVASGSIETSAVEVPEEMDGIAFEDYSPEVQAEYIANENARVDLENEARTTVIDLFSRADKEGYQSILAEAVSEKQANPENYASEALIEQTKETIDAAKTNDAAITALDTLMRFYDISAGYFDAPFADRHDELKEAARAYVDVFSVLPKDFIAKAGLNSVTVSTTAITSASGRGVEGGSYSPSEGSINIVVRGNLFNVAASAGSKLEGDDYSYRAMVGHELGHALSEHQSLGAYLEQDELISTESETDAVAFFGQIGLNHLSIPNHMSMYGRSSSEENTAEVLSGVLSDRSNGLATVDEWRQFGSGANKSMIDMLSQLENIQPGIAKILIANRLM